MNACTSIAKTLETGARPVTHPLVLINGIPEPRLQPDEYQCRGPLDLRTVDLTVTADVDAGIRHRWLNAAAAVVQPLRLSDHQVRYHVLAYGRLQRRHAAYGDRRDLNHLQLQDHWAAKLNRTIPQLWWAVDGQLVATAQTARFEAATRGNRSLHKYEIGGQAVHVLAPDAQPWTIATALQTLSAFAGLDLQTTHLPPEMATLPLATPVNLNRPVEAILHDLCRSCGLVIRRHLTCEGTAVTERRTVQTRDRGRRIALTWADDNHSLGQVLSIDKTSPVRRSQQLIAEADGWRVESTFNLVKVWRPQRENMADVYYDLAASPEPDTYREVYRLWALNEDARFCGEPFNRGAAYDLSALFSQPVPPQPLRFLDTLIVDDTGELKAPIVHMSIDGGQNWTDYPGSYEIKEEYAAVYLNDVQLPAAFLAAARNDLARIRVTASLQSPVPVRFSRWVGNPFSGTRPPRTFRFGNRFAFQRIDRNSIHHGLYDDDALNVATGDGGKAMRTWLLQQAAFERLVGRDRDGKADLHLPQVNTLLHIGDRLYPVGGPGRDAGARAHAITRRDATIENITCRWPTITTSTQGKTFARPARTVIQLRC